MQNIFLIISDGNKPFQRKRILVKNLHKLLSGKYRVQLVGKYCSFERYIQVSVNIKPVIKLGPTTGYKDYIVADEGGTQILTAKVFGGFPPVKVTYMIYDILLKTVETFYIIMLSFW